MAKTKAKLICVFVFTYAKIRFSHDAAHISVIVKYHQINAYTVLIEIVDSNYGGYFVIINR